MSVYNLDPRKDEAFQRFMKTVRDIKAIDEKDGGSLPPADKFLEIFKALGVKPEDASNLKIRHISPTEIIGSFEVQADDIEDETSGCSGCPGCSPMNDDETVENIHEFVENNLVDSPVDAGNPNDVAGLAVTARGPSSYEFIAIMEELTELVINHFEQYSDDFQATVSTNKSRSFND